MKRGQGEIDASTVLLNLSKHLTHLANSIKEIENATSEILDGASKPTSTTVLHLQSLDFARQSLIDCSTLVKLLSMSQGTKKQFLDNGSKLRASVKLESTKVLLDKNAKRQQDSSSGELDVF